MSGVKEFITTHTTSPNGNILTESAIQKVIDDMKPHMIYFDEASHWRESDFEKLYIGADWGFPTTYKAKFKKEKRKMGKATHEDVQEALEEFASLLGLDYSSCREELDGGTIDEKFLPKQKDDLSVELTKETKEKPRDRWSFMEEYYLGFGYRTSRERKPEMEATILGKINAIAEHLGIDFEVQPERVVTTPTKVKAVKRTTTKKTPVKAVKKGKR